MTCTEIAIIPVSAGSQLMDTQSSTGKLLLDCLSTISDQEGCRKIYYGTQRESPDILQLMIEWDALESHQNFMNADIYTPFRTKLGTLCTGPPDMTHSHFQFPIHPALNGEITGMLRLYVPTGTDQSEWEAKHWKPYEELVRKAGDEGAGLTGVSAGWCVEEVEKDGEKCDVFVIIAGWKNVEAQMEAGKKEEYQEVLKGLREGAKGSDMSRVAYATFK